MTSAARCGTVLGMDLYAELTALIHELERDGLDYALCGALAVAIHGAPRATKDIDLLVAPESIAAVLAAAKRRGFVYVAQPMRFAASGVTITRVSKLVDGHPLVLDLLHADGVLAEPWSTRVRARFLDGELSVVSRAGLVTLKLAAGRPQDIWDLQRLEEAHHGDDEP